MPKEPGPSTRTPVCACTAARSGLSPSETPAKMPARTSPGISGATGPESAAKMARVSRLGILVRRKRLDRAGEPALRQIGQQLPADAAIRAEHRQRARAEHAFGVETGSSEGAGRVHAAGAT